jgi:hypothetical protein
VAAAGLHRIDYATVTGAHTSVVRTLPSTPAPGDVITISDPTGKSIRLIVDAIEEHGADTTIVATVSAHVADAQVT